MMTYVNNRVKVVTKTPDKIGVETKTQLVINNKQKMWYNNTNNRKH